MSEAASIAKAIYQTIEECIDKVNSVDDQVQKLRDVWANIEWPNYKARVNSMAYTDLLDKSFIKRTDTLTAFNNALKSMIDFIEEEKPIEKQEQNKETTKPTQTSQKEQNTKPKKEVIVSDVSDISDDEGETIKVKEPKTKKELEKNEAFFHDVMCLLTQFTTKLESMLREHLAIKDKAEEQPKPNEEQPKQQEAQQKKEVQQPNEEEEDQYQFPIDDSPILYSSESEEEEEPPKKNTSTKKTTKKSVEKKSTKKLVKKPIMTVIEEEEEDI